MRSFLLLSVNYSYAQSPPKDNLRELQLAAGGLSFFHNVEENGPIELVSREGPIAEEEVGKKKKKNVREREVPQRGFKTYHLDEAIESWQMKFKDVQEEFRKMNKKDLKAFVAEGRQLNFKSLLAEVLGDTMGDDEQGVNKFSDYGCYCLPLDNGSDKFEGKGRPVDEIDELCMSLWNCHRCAKVDQGRHCDGQNNYDWYAKVTGKIKCGGKDYNDTCQGQICQCDMEFANRLRMLGKNLSQKYSPEYHKEGGFSRNKRCVGPNDKRSTTGNKTGKDPIEKARPVSAECCGTGISRSPFKPERFECCADGRIAIIGEC